MFITLTDEEYIADIVKTAKNIGKKNAIEIIHNIVASRREKDLWFVEHKDELIEAIQKS